MRRILIIISLVVLIGLVATVVYAAIPSSQGVITGCRQNSTGSLRVIDAEAGATCAGNETQLAWPSAHKHTGYVLVTNSVQFNNIAGEQLGVSAQCPTGKVILNGGFSLGANDVTIIRSTPEFNPHQQFVAGKADSDGSDGLITAWANCIDG